MGQFVGRVRQALPRLGKVRRRNGLPIGPDDALPQGKGICGVPRVVGFHRIALRLPIGQYGPAIAAVLPAKEVFKQVVQNRLPASGGNGGGVQGILGSAHLDGEDVRPGVLTVRRRLVLRRLFSAGAQRQRQQRAQKGGPFFPHRSHHFASTWTSFPSSPNFTGWIWLRVCLAMSLSRTMLG